MEVLFESVRQFFHSCAIINTIGIYEKVIFPEETIVKKNFHPYLTNYQS